jgi:hypothetical protein
MEERYNMVRTLKKVPRYLIDQCKGGLEACVETGFFLSLAPHFLPTISRIDAVAEERPYSIGVFLGEKSGLVIACAAWVVGVSYYLDCLKTGSPFIIMPVATNIASHFYERKKAK